MFLRTSSSSTCKSITRHHRHHLKDRRYHWRRRSTRRTSLFNLKSTLRYPRAFRRLSNTNRISTASFSSDNFLSGTASNYVDAQYEIWKRDPTLVHSSWDSYFRTGDFSAPPSLGGPAVAIPQGVPQDGRLAEDLIKLFQMVRTFQVRGHFKSSLDPLGIFTVGSEYLNIKQFEFTSYWNEEDKNRTFDLGNHTLISGFLDSTEEERNMPLSQLYNRLQETYCGNIGYEFMHIASREQCDWIRTRIETPRKTEYSKDEKLVILDRLTWAHHFENFLHLKWVAQKRFGLDGAESMIPGLKAIIDCAGELGIEDIVMGMPHRGRLNVLSTVIRKPLEQIFHEFSGMGVEVVDPDIIGSGDVKYHLGCSFDRPTYSGKTIHISMVANPSHLEAVNPVVLGKTRSKQQFKGDIDGSKSMGILIHGDASFAGQGTVYETLAMSDLTNYTTGGVIHFICNNQIGFTTDPQYARSTPYCSDVAKAIGAPVFHVNGDDPEAVCRVSRLAMEFRQKFKKDVVIDLVCYRKYGHNEGDEPTFTQPRMYEKIKNHKNVLFKYRDELIEEGVCNAEAAQALSDRCHAILEESFEKSKGHNMTKGEWLDENWEGLLDSNKISQVRETGVSKDVLQNMGKKIYNLPNDFILHRKLEKVMKARKLSLETGERIDWGTAEALSFGSLLLEGVHVRLSGQDVERGTFSHRHAVIHDQVADPTRTFVPLKHLDEKQADVSVVNSNLSEFGALGYEYGYSLEQPQSLVLWEAQFGDFANGAQIMFDQFISSGEDKWLRQSGLVVLLPHGYEGAGPEHSSARMERYLQMSSDHPDHFPPMDEIQRSQIQKTNWQIANCSTPANYFHVLRRQCHRDFRKPLIVFTPKSLLKLRQCVSKLDDFSENTRFIRLIPERSNELVEDDKITKFVLCSGKVYYDLIHERTRLSRNDVSIATVEQLSPFPFDLVKQQANRYPNAELIWCQEEPLNMGAWTYVEPRIVTSLRDTLNTRPRYAGRPPSASPATGFGAATHKAEIETFLKQVFE